MIQMKLKQKYLTTAKGQLGYKPQAKSGNGLKKRPGHHKLSDMHKKNLPVQPKRILVVQANGKKVMMNYADAWK